MFYWLIESMTSKWAQRIKDFVDKVDELIETGKHILITKGTAPTIHYATKSLAAILLYKESKQLGSKTERMVNYTEGKLNQVMTHLDTKNGILEAIVKQEIEQKINEYSWEGDTLSPENLEKLVRWCNIVTDQTDKQEKPQINMDLHKEEARVNAYLEIFTEMWIDFDDQDKLKRELIMLCKLDPELEIWLQQQLLSLANARG